MVTFFVICFLTNMTLVEIFFHAPPQNTHLEHKDATIFRVHGLVCSECLVFGHGADTCGAVSQAPIETSFEIKCHLLVEVFYH